jgi:hypothetical protein
MSFGSICIIVTYPRIAVPITVIVTVGIVTVDEWAEVSEVSEVSEMPEVVDSKIVEPGPTPTAYTAVESHVTAPDQLDWDLTLRPHDMVYCGHGVVDS